MPNREECEFPKRSTPLTRSVARKAARVGLSIIRQVSDEVGMFIYLQTCYKHGYKYDSCKIQMKIPSPLGLSRAVLF